jgi:ABC-type branched-subunit amino acid transport system ATPase component
MMSTAELLAPDCALSTTDLTVAFGGTKALDSFTMSVRNGERVGLIGPNGAGKSTFINAVTGNLRSAGTIHVEGRHIRGMTPHRRARLGLVRTFQHLGLFTTMTVAENIEIGRRRPGAAVADDGAESFEVGGIAELLGLDRRLGAVVRDLPYGTRKLVELARAMASRPRVLLLDEPVAGLDTAEKAKFVKVLGNVLDQLGCATVLVEHDMFTVEALTSRVYVLSSGTQIAAGSFAEVARDPLVVSAYLGE